MATKLPWVKLYPSQFLKELMVLKPEETAVYTILVLLMIDFGGSIPNKTSDLKIVCGCSEWTFRNILESLMNRGYIIRLEDGSLWHTSSAFDLDISNTPSEK
ncbi:DUF1376 domain-containing protein [Bartonella schoenbuchensis]|uniref:Phage related protein n=1 Tax=Bartonella schoenbuchensis (strain DSM 13525 / NCTC 13165 / R1) TaxID=687861 RepID=E6Z086_BARSR|nr:DUF1376 domain-containing protein [Bartonella schoenbuchensis]AQX30993.1 Protein of unknown function (DUF1376) [Bartonella schoenbuchensis R1]CBI82524.1 conserved hypothetical protein [Bartonella schoenbuchensis R1]